MSEDPVRWSSGGAPPGGEALVRSIEPPPPLPDDVRARVRARLVRDGASGARAPRGAVSFGVLALGVAAVALVVWRVGAGRGPTAPRVAPLAAARAPRGERPDASSAPAQQAPTTGGAAPWVVPDLEASGDGCGLVMRLACGRLDPRARSVAVVAVPASPGQGSELRPASCDPSRVVAELPRELFAACGGTEQSRGVGSVLVRAAADAAGCDASYLVLACARDAAGQLHSEPDDGSRSLGRVVSTASRDDAADPAAAEPTLATPSGPVIAPYPQGALEVRSVVPASGDPVVVRVRSRRPQRAEAPRVVLELASRHALGVRADAEVFRPARHDFVRASALRAGDEVLTAERGVERVTRAFVDGTRLGDLVDVDYPDTLFVDGLLVRDARPTPSGATAPPPFVVADEPVRVVPAPMSYDCQLGVRVEARDVPRDATALALVVTAHRGPSGALEAPRCDAARVAAVVPRAAFDAGLAALRGAPIAYEPARPFALALDLAGDPVECASRYAISACWQTAGGALRAASSVAPTGLSGASCFVAGTMVDTPGGRVPIERLARGDRVVSFDLDADQRVESLVQQLVRHPDRTVLDLELDDGTRLGVTPEHPIYVEARGFVLARNLAAGDRVRRVDGRTARVVRASARAAREDVYELGVSAPDDYFAGGVLVHNY